VWAVHRKKPPGRPLGGDIRACDLARKRRHKIY
jgi:hypothetical protein